MEYTQAVVVVRNPEIVENAKPKVRLMTSAKAISSSPASTPKAQGSIDFSVGDNVLHKAFGQGLVISAQPVGNDMLLEVAFDKVGTKKIMAKFANIQKV